jgi:hypothetical protein
MTEHTKKHMHTVQKEYLKGFSIKENDRHFIWRLDKTTGNIKKLPIKNVLVENFFYSQEVEDWLAEEIEGPGIAVIKKIIDKEAVVLLTQSEKIKVAKWIIIQDLRTREYQEQIRQISERIGDDSISSIFPNLSTFEEFTKNVQWYMMQRFEQSAPDIAKRNWCLCINNTDLPLYTSDHPVIKNNSLIRTIGRLSGKRALNQGEGYFSKGVELNLPLTPKLLLILIDISPMYDFLNKLPSERNYILYQISPEYQSLYNGMIDRCNELTKNKKELSEINVVYYNDRIISESYQYVLSKTNNFQMANECLDRIPEARMRDRRRWDVF